jgi:hypothetical protein
MHSPFIRLLSAMLAGLGLFAIGAVLILGVKMLSVM